MNLLLTDLLDCPQCLAGIGLILLADRVEGRRVYEGQLGCPQCRAKYAVAGGVAFFGADPSMGESAASPADPMEVAALLGITEGPATVLMLGEYEGTAEAMAGLIPDVQVVVAHAGAGAGDSLAVSSLRVGTTLPLRAMSMRGVLVGPDAVASGDALRVCGLAGRLVWYGASEEIREQLVQRGFRVIAQDTDRVVAVRVA